VNEQQDVDFAFVDIVHPAIGQIQLIRWGSLVSNCQNADQRKLGRGGEEFAPGPMSMDEVFAVSDRYIDQKCTQAAWSSPFYKRINYVRTLP
jgi:hypothetical protein